MSEGHSAFFYGILMHPKILLGVISNDGSHLKLCPAVLLVSSTIFNLALYYHADFLLSRNILVIKSRFLGFSRLDIFIQFDREDSSMLIIPESYHTQRGKPCLKIVNIARRRDRFEGYW